jgi:hypothetical protein
MQFGKAGGGMGQQYAFGDEEEFGDDYGSNYYDEEEDQS